MKNLVFGILLVLSVSHVAVAKTKKASTGKTPTPSPQTTLPPDESASPSTSPAAAWPPPGASLPPDSSELGANRISLNGGLGFGLKTSGKVKASTTEVDLAGTDGATSFFLEGEYSRKLAPMFALGVSLGYFQYKYDTATASDPDKVYSFLLIPRFESTFDPLILWVGFGIGAAHTSLTNGAALSSLGFSTTSTALALSPRIGLDFALTRNLFFGWQSAYAITFPSFSGTVSGVPVEINLQRSSWQTGLRFGMIF